MYDSLKGQVLANHVAVAAVDEAEVTLQTARATNRFADRLPGVRTGISMHSHPGGAVQPPGGNRLHNRQGSGVSGYSGQQRGGAGLAPAPNYAQYMQGCGLSGRVHTSRKSTL